VVIFFSRKEAKALVLLRRRFVDPKLGEADLGGLGACPRKTTRYVVIFNVLSKVFCCGTDLTVFASFSGKMKTVAGHN
jgi:hypothetical protein